MIKKAKKSNSKNSQISTGVLVLENKRIFKGIGIGYQGEATGEVCFNTSLTGYQEIISDPSYAGQIINFTFPHIGNVGTNKEDYESDKIWTKGVVFNSEITYPSNYRSFQHLDAWLKKNKIVGITGLDTRSLTNFIRDKGAPKGTIAYSKIGKFNISKLTNSTIKWSGLKNLDLAEKVTTSKNYIWKGLKTWKKETGYKKNNKNSFHVVAIDYGIKKNILRYFSDFNCKVNIVSCKTSVEKILKLKPNGVFLSNGPGDPAATGKYAIGIIKEIIKKDLPVFGVSESELNSMNMPVIIIPGNDKVHDSAAGRIVHEMIPGSELHKLPIEDQDLPLVPFEEWGPHEPEITEVFTEFMSKHSG